MEKLLGDHMLRGWVLLAESCPVGCNVPLVQNKNTGLRKCVQCNFESSKAEAANKPAPKVMQGTDIPSKASPSEWVIILREILASQTISLAQGLNVTSYSADDTSATLGIIERLIKIHQMLETFK